MQVISITLGISLTTWLAVCAITACLLPYIRVTSGMMASQLAIFCSLLGTLMIARSPASAIAVLQETGGRGAFCSLVLTVVVVKDVFTIVVFALNIEIARSLFKQGIAAEASLIALAKPFVSLVVAVALGVGGSWVVSTAEKAALMVSHYRVAPYVKSSGILVISTFVFEVAAFFDAEPLLACAVTGLLASNTL
jgi:hypothetical protein